MIGSLWFMFWQYNPYVYCNDEVKTEIECKILRGDVLNDDIFNRFYARVVSCKPFLDDASVTIDIQYVKLWSELTDTMDTDVI